MNITGLSGQNGLALDSVGNLFAVNLNANSVTVYAPTATGNAAPIRTISGGNTNLVGPQVFSCVLEATGTLVDLHG